MLTKSTRTAQLDEAKRFALAFHHSKVHQTTSELMADTVPAPVRFGELAKQLMRHEATRKDRGEFAELSYRADQIRLATEIIPFFGPMPVKAITAQHVESFYFKLTSRALSSTTLSLYLMTLRKVLKYARTLNIIETLPTMPSVKIKKRSRGSFTPTEYVTLIRNARAVVGSTVLDATEPIPKRFWIIPKYRRYPQDLAYVIAFMVNSFIRPSDLKTLRHRHVEVVRGPHNSTHSDHASLALWHRYRHVDTRKKCENKRRDDRATLR